MRRVNTGWTTAKKTRTGDDRPGRASAIEIGLEEARLRAEDRELIDRLKELPMGYWDFREDDTKAFTHGIHNYPAMMVCPISRNIIKLMQDIRPVEALFDPFAGSGTVLVEGMLGGVQTVSGNDSNPLARLLTKAKTTRIEQARLTAQSTALLGRIHAQRERLACALASADAYITDTLQLDLAEKRGWGDEASKHLQAFCEKYAPGVDVPSFKNIGYWFRPRVILELAVIRAEIKGMQDPDVRDYAYTAFSETIRLVSNKRNGEFKMFRMPAEKVQCFRPDVFGEFERILLRNNEKMGDFCKALEARHANPEVRVYGNDARALSDIPDGAYDLIITSPPYGDSRTTVAYGEYSRLSLQWIDQFGMTDKEILGVDKSLMGGKKCRNGFALPIHSPTLRAALTRIMDADAERAGDVYSFYTDLDAAIQSIAKKTKPGGYQFWVVGNRTVKNELLRTDRIMAELAAQYGMTAICTIGRNIPNKVMPSRNSPTNITGATIATMTKEHIVVFRKE